MTRKLIAGLALLLLAPAARADTAKMRTVGRVGGPQDFDEQMKPLYTEYQTIHKALAADSTKGIDKAAKKIAKLAPKLDPAMVTGKHAGHYKDLPRKIKAAAERLAKAKGIVGKREAFKDLSKPFAMWATMSRPAGVNVVFCSMAKGSWLQSEKTIANPYYGAKMLRCGEVVSGEHKGTADGHMKHTGHAR